MYLNLCAVYTADADPALHHHNTIILGDHVWRDDSLVPGGRVDV